MIEFNPWPATLAHSYREKGYWIDRPLSDILRDRAAQQPDNIAIMCGERELSYAQFQQYVDNLSAYLFSIGIKAGDAAVVQLPNVAEFYVVFFALLQSGIVPVNALFNHQRFELEHYVKQVRPSLIIGSAQHALWKDDTFFRRVKPLAEEESHAKPCRCLIHGESDYALRLEDAMQAHSSSGTVDSPLSLSPTPSDQVAFFQLSGGSTGTPKLIPRTHNDYYYSVRRSAELTSLSPATRFLCALPAAHNFPLSSPGALGVFYAGGCVVLAKSPEANHCFSLIQQHRVNMTALVPSAVILWLQLAEQDGEKEKLRSLQLLQVGGASFAEDLARRAVDELGCQLQQVFGMAEGLVNYTRLNGPDEEVFTTQGRPMSEADEIKVINAEGREALVNEPGLLYTRGPYTFRGYYQAAEHNEKAFDAEGYYGSGDIVVKDANGNLRVIGRAKDQINRGGEKVSSEEIENLLLKHPEIERAAIIAIPDPLMGEKSCACIVVKSSPVKAVSVRKFLRELGVAEYKFPDRIECLTNLPETAVGKTDKVALRKSVLQA